MPVAELCHNYDLDGIHFDDYFYPTTDPAFDADDYAAAGTALSLDDWRRQNVNALMALCYRTAHQYGVRFGVAPIGDPDAATPTNTVMPPYGWHRAAMWTI